ncbi:MAG: TIGR01212 family radical SAM protein [Firmicutes bacterium]|nr:TIGR01212 family radical SAM protein [Bacillota bacterium]
MVVLSREKPINTIGSYLKDRFGIKVVKLALDGGFTCPNRDGSKGTGGCLFCSDTGSGDTAGDIQSQIKLLSDKWPSAKYIAYLQNHTNTYAPADKLRRVYEDALTGHPDIVGLAVATRPDCLSDEVLDVLDEFNRKTFMWVELGLQTIHEQTASAMNRCYGLSAFDEAVSALSQRNIRSVIHLIFGLPGETRDMMLDSVRYVCSGDIFGLKMHLLNVVKNSALGREHPDYVPFDSMDEYINLVCDALEIIPPDITIHRMTGDAPRPILISPEWSYKKRSILNGIHLELHRRKTWQGINAE